MSWLWTGIRYPAISANTGVQIEPTQCATMKLPRKPAWIAINRVDALALVSLMPQSERITWTSRTSYTTSCQDDQ